MSFISIGVILLIIIILCWLVSPGWFGGTTPPPIVTEAPLPSDGTKVKIYEYHGLSPGPTVCLIAGVHGNEYAGTVALEQMMKDGIFNIKRGKLRVIPRANPWGLKNGVRYQYNIWHPDLNRNFFGEGLEPVSQNILNILGDADVVLDFHEGWGYYKQAYGSVGSTVSPTTHPLAKNLASRIVDIINKQMPPGIPDHKRFSIIWRLSCDIPGTLSCYMENRKRAYILMETSGQNDIQPVEVRAGQVKKAVMTAIAPLC